MKKIIMIAMLLFCFGISYSQTLFKTTAFAYKIEGEKWSDWERSSLNILMDESTVIIFSSETQVYNLLDVIEEKNNSIEGQSLKIRAIDQDKKVCNIRLRIEPNGNSQIYVDYNDVTWVYNVIRQ